MNVLKKPPVLILLASSFLIFACVYVVLPEGLEDPGTAERASTGVWSAVVTNVGTSDAGDLHVDITIRNDTGDWSTMRSVPNQPAVLKSGDGKTVNCDTVLIGTGGHRLAPGFQMRGYTTGSGDAAQVQTLYIECKDAVFSAGSKLSINYESFNGILDDYDPEANKTEGVLDFSLDEVTTDLTYPVAASVEGLIQDSGLNITALSENVVTLLDAQRTDAGLQFKWQNFNPTKFPLRTHIGIPPVIGSDGVIYGVYETLDIAPVDITPPNENMQWTTEVAVPPQVTNCFILLSVESNKPRTYINYALDITNK